MREPTSESPYVTSNLSPRQNTQEEHDAELIQRGRVYVEKSIGEVGKNDSDSLDRCKMWAESLLMNTLRKYGASPQGSREVRIGMSENASDSPDRDLGSELNAAASSPVDCKQLEGTANVTMHRGSRTHVRSKKKHSTARSVRPDHISPSMARAIGPSKASPSTRSDEDWDMLSIEL